MLWWDFKTTVNKPQWAVKDSQNSSITMWETDKEMKSWLYKLVKCGLAKDRDVCRGLCDL